VRLRGATEDRNAPIVASTHTAQGILRVPAKDSAQGIVVFEQPTLVKGDRVVLTFRGADIDTALLQLNVMVGN
jgi:hypothetical protein